MKSAETPEIQYLEIMKACKNGVKVYNKRTNTYCFTSLNHQIKFDGSQFPICTTRKSYWRQAICEMIGYIRGYDDLDDFHSIGVKTWDANCEAWWNPAKKSDTHLGIIYGASAECVGVPYTEVLAQIEANPHDRGIIWSFWNPEHFEIACLRPCMFAHQFNVMEGELHLTSYQRSADVPLGLNFNMMQCWFMLNITAQLTGLRVGSICMNLTNCHIYEDQMPGVIEQLKRKPFDPPQVIGLEKMTFDDLMESLDPLKNVSLINYQHHPAIHYKMTA